MLHLDDAGKTVQSRIANNLHGQKALRAHKLRVVQGILKVEGSLLAHGHL